MARNHAWEDQPEELDYEEEDTQGHEDVSDLPGPSFAVEEPSMSRNNIGPFLPPNHSIGNIGPALPPGMMLGNFHDSAPDDPCNTPEDPGQPQIGPVIPVARNVVRRPDIGPSLPPHNDFEPSLSDGELSRSSLPPPEPVETRTIGPAMPPGFIPDVPVVDEEEEGEDAYGPALPPPPGAAAEPESDDDEIVGPLPPPANMDEDKAAEEYAIRRLMLEKQNEASSSSKREEWMTQLPKKLVNYGLGARTFNKSAGAEKDSSWTETPEQKRRRLEQGDGPSTSSDVDLSQLAQRRRDEEQEKIATEINKNRNESMLDSHSRKRKAADQDTSNGDTTGRKAFDREADMQVRGLKPTSTAEIKERCGQLTSRFGTSNNQKFL